MYQQEELLDQDGLLTEEDTFESDDDTDETTRLKPGQPLIPPVQGGLLDPTFGTGGIVTVLYGNYQLYPPILPNPQTDPLTTQTVILPQYVQLAFGTPLLSSVVDGQRRLLVTISGLGILVTYRFLDSGAPDTTFGNNGQVITFIPDIPQLHTSTSVPRSGFGTIGVGLMCSGQAIAVDRQGRIIVAGVVLNTDRDSVTFGPPPFYSNLTSGTLSGDMLLVRYNYDGSLDTTFGDRGIVRFNNNNQVFTINAIASDQEDRIIVAGQAAGLLGTVNSGISQVALARFIGTGTTDLKIFPGKVDTTFGNKGLILQNFAAFPNSPPGTFFQSAYDVMLDPNGNILMIGIVGLQIPNSPTDPVNLYVFIARYLPAIGALDTSFNKIGFLKKLFVTCDQGQNINTPYYFTLQPPKTQLNENLYTIIVGGTGNQTVPSKPFPAPQSPTDQFQIAVEFSDTGAFNKKFGQPGNNGIAKSRFPTFFNNTSSFVTGITLDVLGNIILGGSDVVNIPVNTFNFANAFGLTRFTPKGLLDPTFGPTRNGQVITPIYIPDPNNPPPATTLGNVFAGPVTIDGSGRINIAGIIIDTPVDPSKVSLYIAMVRYASDYANLYNPNLNFTY